MTVKTTVDAELGLVIQEASGQVTLDKAKSAFDAAMKTPGFEKDMPVVWDLRQADLTPGGNLQDISAMVDHMQRGAAERGQGYKVAFVVGRKVDFGLARMFEALASDLPLKIQVFRSMDEARGWVCGEDMSAAPAQIKP